MSMCLLVWFVFGFLTHQNVDVCGHSDTQTVDVVRRQLLQQAHNHTDVDKIAGKPQQTAPLKSNAGSNNASVVAQVAFTKANRTLNKANETKILDLHSNGTNIVHNKKDHEHNGALLRSFYVFLGLSIIVLIYISIRTFR